MGQHAPKRPRSPLRGRGIFGFLELLLFSMCSHQVPNGFLTSSPSSQCVPQQFSQVPNAFPNMFPIVPHFVPYALPNIVRLKPIWVGLHWDLHVSMFGVNTYILGSLESFKINFFVMGQSKRLIARPPKQRKIWTWNAPPPQTDWYELYIPHELRTHIVEITMFF